MQEQKEWYGSREAPAGLTKHSEKTRLEFHSIAQAFGDALSLSFIY